ncbi:MAG: carbon storage regulator [Selenomonas sp.]|nr:carbon storage regulator [Selenomonas sp.]
MLVLARKAQQEIIIGDKIIVSIVKVYGNKIKIGITAPSSVSVYRPECRREPDSDGTDQNQGNRN